MSHRQGHVIKGACELVGGAHKPSGNAPRDRGDIIFLPPEGLSRWVEGAELRGNKISG